MPPRAAPSCFMRAQNNKIHVKREDEPQQSVEITIIYHQREIHVVLRGKINFALQYRYLFVSLFSFRLPAHPSSIALQQRRDVCILSHQRLMIY
jgi:hypothetical protein